MGLCLCPLGVQGPRIDPWPSLVSAHTMAMGEPELPGDSRHPSGSIGG